MLKSDLFKFWGCGILGVFTIGSILLMIVLLSLTVKNVEQTEYAVGYDNYTMEFTKIYDQGRYITRVGEYFILMPRTYQEYSSVVSCLTKDKVVIDIDFALQYQYNKESLESIILKEFDGHAKYKKFIQNRVLSSILETCLEYDAEQYYILRGEIDIKIYDELVKNINNQNIGSTISFFQLVNIKFPKKFSTVIVQKQTIQQEALTAYNDRQSILINSQTLLYESERTASIILINANNTASIILNKANIDAHAEYELWNQRAIGYQHTANILKLNSTDIIDYIETENIKKSNKLYSST